MEARDAAKHLTVHRTFAPQIMIRPKTSKVLRLQRLPQSSYENSNTIPQVEVLKRIAVS